MSELRPVVTLPVDVDRVVRMERFDPVHIPLHTGGGPVTVYVVYGGAVYTLTLPDDGDDVDELIVEARG